MKKTILLSLASLCVFTLNAQHIDTRRSEVRFTLSNLKWRSIEGTFTGIRGDIIFNEKDLENSNFRVCFDASTIHTGNEKRDASLRSADYFEVETYPLVCFNSEKISKRDVGFRTTGQLTMHGITKDVVIDFTFIDNMFRGRMTVMRYDYRIGLQTGTFKVGNEVDMQIYCVLEE